MSSSYEGQVLLQSQKVQETRRLVCLLCEAATHTEADEIWDAIGASLLDGGNQKKFWSFNRTENMGLTMLSDTDGLHITRQTRAECLNQFASVFTCHDGTNVTDKEQSPYCEMGNICFMQPGIEKLLKNINQTKAAGPDELSARILKEITKEICGVLSYIFQQSYQEGTVPSD